MKKKGSGQADASEAEEAAGWLAGWQASLRAGQLPDESQALRRLFVSAWFTANWC